MRPNDLMAYLYTDVSVGPHAQLAEDLFFEGAIKTVDEIFEIIGEATREKDLVQITVPYVIYGHIRRHLEKLHIANNIDSIYINKVKLVPV